MSLLAQDERLTRRVGAATLALITLAIVFFVFVYDRIDWGHHVRIKVYFHSTGGLREGAAFVVGGQDVGRIESITLVPRGTQCLLDNDEGVVVEVAIDGDAAGQIQYGGDVFVTSRGALSGRYLEIGPAPDPAAPEASTLPACPQTAAMLAAAHELRPLREGDELVGKDPPTLDRVLQRTWDNLMTTAKFAAAVRPEMDALTVQVDQLRAQIKELAPDVHLRDDIDALVAEARNTYAALGGEAGLDHLRNTLDLGGATLDQARATIAKLRTSANQLSAGLDVVKARLGTRGAEAVEKVQLAIDRVRAAMDRVDPLLAQVDALRGQIERNEGSLLKLMHDPEFPEDAKELGKILKRQPWKVIARPAK